jgi:ParB family transcriptional regulator, chromosome partitioning protein
MTTSNSAAVDKAAEKAGAAKGQEKLAERRRALGRGLESLLPGPRVVPMAPTLPQSARKDGAPAGKDGAPASSSSSELSGGWAGTPVAPVNVLGELQAVAAPDGEQVLELALDKIDENPYQTRQDFDPKALGDLAGSIQAQGVLQPIVVRPGPVRPGLVREGVAPTGGLAAGSEQRFILILGERRFRASKIAGRTTIPVIVKRVSTQQAAEMTLVENLQRQDLDCLEQAQAFANLSTQFNLTQEEIGKRVGVSREQVSNYLRLLKLPPTVQMALRKKELTYSHARLLLSLDDDHQIVKMALTAIAKKMSVALLEELVMYSHIPKDPAEARKVGGARWVDPNVRAEQRSLEAILGMRVRIRDRKGKGKITIEYATLEDFDRVVTMLKGN